jgi:hypothetical protein
MQYLRQGRLGKRFIFPLQGNIAATALVTQRKCLGLPPRYSANGWCYSANGHVIRQTMVLFNEA